MNRPVVKYSSVVIALAAGFMNFVACGAQIYQVSLEDDYGGTPQGDVGTHGRVGQGYSALNYIHTALGWGAQNLPIRYRFSQEMTEEQKQGIRNAIKTWETAVGKQLFLFDGIDQKTGDDFMDLYSSLQDSINGYYRDDQWHKTNKSERVIATTIWDNVAPVTDPSQGTIAKADIRFNYQHYNIGDSFAMMETDSRSVVDMESLALHEIGHLLGLAHVPASVDSYSIMNPALLIGEGLANRRVSEGDIRRIQQIYGCEGKACDIKALYMSMEVPTYNP